MTIIELIEILKKIAQTQPNINSTGEGDIYEFYNSNPSVKYSTFFITQNQHSSTDAIDRYSLTLFYTDRLQDDMGNRLSIQSTGKQVLSNIIMTFTEEFDADCSEIRYQPFTQRFNDMCAGVYATLTFEIARQDICRDNYGYAILAEKPKITIKNQIKSVNYNSNGDYTVGYDNGFTGLEKVDIHIDVPTPEPVLKGVKIDKNGVYTPEEGTDGYNRVEVEVPETKPELEELKAIRNGIYRPTKYGYSKVEVAVPEKQFTTEVKNVQIVENGQTVVDKSVNKDGMTQVVINTNVPTGGKTKLKDFPTVKLQGGTFTRIPVDAFDFTGLYDWSYLFKNCQYLATLDGIDTTTIEKAESTFENCSDLNLPDFTDLSNCTDMDNTFLKCTGITGSKRVKTGYQYITSNTFNGCTGLEEIRLEGTGDAIRLRWIFNGCTALRKAYIETDNATMLTNLFQGCSSLTEARFSNTDRLTIANNIFQDCTSLTTIPQLTGKIEDMDFIVKGCTALTSFPSIDCENLTTAEEIFGNRGSGGKPLTNLTEVGAFRNIKVNLYLNLVPNISKVSIYNILQGLYDFVGNGDTLTTRSIYFSPEAYLKITADMTAIATAKGWRVIQLG